MKLLKFNFVFDNTHVHWKDKGVTLTSNESIVGRNSITHEVIDWSAIFERCRFYAITPKRVLLWRR